MIESPFGSTSTMWTAAPTPGIALQTPLQTPVALGNSWIGGHGLGSSPLLGGPGTMVPVGRDMPIFSTTPAYAYPANAITASGLSASNPFPFAGSAPPALANPEAGMGVSAPALLAAVAMRRGQPQGPANDHEVEDFIYDALELLSGTADVDVRCEGGRATLTGTVHHKRAKRDVGEIAWAIPGVNDVQNNITIASRRRARASRETDTANAQTRK
jgi:hypothetical protein